MRVTIDGTAGGVVSIISVCVPAVDTLPAASVAVTDTGLLPLALSESRPSVGAAVLRSICQAPPVAATV